MNFRYLLTLCMVLLAPPALHAQLWMTSYENIGSYTTSELEVIEQINNADENCSWANLKSILEYCSINYPDSSGVSIALTEWLHENHNIYSGKSPIEVRQYRGYLMYSLSKFQPSYDLFTYVTYELQTSTKIFNLAAAAHTAKILNTNIHEIIQLLNNQLARIIQDEWVDITTYTLDYPLKKPTKAKYEIIKTLGEFGVDAQTSTKLLHQIVENENKRLVDKDIKLIQLAEVALQKIKGKSKTPFLCCHKNTSSLESVEDTAEGYVIIDKKERNSIPIDELSMIDQNGKKVNFRDILGKPFVLTFFYTSCANALKCASTLEKLGELQKMIMKTGLFDKVGVYAMTYDPDFDTPEILRNYGKTFEIKFSKNFKFLIPLQDDKIHFFNAIDLKVNYGVGTVNHHGTQLFICDNRGGIAMSYQNTIWKSEDILHKLKIILKE